MGALRAPLSLPYGKVWNMARMIGRARRATPCACCDWGRMPRARRQFRRLAKRAERQAWKREEGV